MERARAIVRSLAAQGSALVVLPDLAGHDTRAVTDREFLPLFAELSAEEGTMLVVQLAERDNDRTFKTVYLMRGQSLLATHRQTHLSAPELEAGFSAGDAPPPVVETVAGRAGLLGGSEGLAPELARSLKLRGAELIVWTAGDLLDPVRVIARARAHENRVYVAAAGTTTDAGGAYLIDPTGGVLGETLAGEQMATSADINRALARWNEMAPETNPVRDHDPAAFPSLFRESPSR
jgi:predicted amidohydrolase